MKKLSIVLSCGLLCSGLLYAVDYNSMTLEQLEALKGTIPVEQRDKFQEVMRNKKQNQNQVNKGYRDEHRELKLQEKEERKEMKQLHKDDKKQLMQEFKEQKKEQQEQFLQERKKQNEGGQRKGMM